MQKIFIGPITKGLEQFYLPFNIDNDAFPTMNNFYTWRGRVKRKRGTIALDRFRRQIKIGSFGTASLSLSGGAANLLSLISPSTGASIAPGTISITVGANTYTDPVSPGPYTGILTGTPAGSGTINYSTGAITISGGGSSAVTGTFSYFPGLPGMGLRDLNLADSQYPVLLGFDTKYAYQINTSTALFYSVSFYKTSNNPVVWSGQNYQQFWTTNYQGALWATNNNPGMQFVKGTYSSGSPGTTITFNFKSGGVNFTTLVVGDVLWFNEWGGGSTINGITGSVSDVSGAASGNYVVTFGSSQTVSGTGIAQLLTNSTGSGDGIKWYDGDMTSQTGLPTMGNTTGWVNFAPPLSSSAASIEDVPAGSGPYYLAGATAIAAFKDRLLFFAPYIQLSDGSSPILLADTVIWSWNGTPYYTTPVPSGQSADGTAYYVNVTGKGGYLSAGNSQQIFTVNNNEDVILVGFGNRQTRFVYTGNDLFPFLFYNINVEFGSSATFSGITLDRGAITFGLNGLVLTSQVGSQRIDLSIPDTVFQLKGNSSTPNSLRISSARDYYHEWAYFTFVPNNSNWDFPTQTLQFNYRENSWALHYENFTAHGLYRPTTGMTWATIPFASWEAWNEAWNSASSTALFPNVVAATPQGFVVQKGQGTGEAPTGSIAAIAQSGTDTQITSYNHCVAVGDYLYFTSAIGETFLNNLIGMVQSIVDANNFVVDISFPASPGTYLGLGVFTRLIQPLLQTKQFPIYWNEGRKVILGPQKYLFDTTTNGQATINIYLSQDPDNSWNSTVLVPNDETTNSSLVYSQVIFTCPESTNIGLTQITQSINNPSPIANTQRQIWHRMNTSLIGDTFQVGITLNDAQMRNLNYATSEITLHAMQLDVSRGPFLS